MFGAWAPCTCTIVTCTCTCTMLHVLHGTLVVRYILFRKCTPVLGERIGSYILHVRTRPVGPADSVVMTLYLMEEQTLCGCYHWWAGCMVSAFVSQSSIHPSILGVCGWVCVILSCFPFPILILKLSLSQSSWKWWQFWCERCFFTVCKHSIHSIIRICTLASVLYCVSVKPSYVV